MIGIEFDKPMEALDWSSETSLSILFRSVGLDNTGGTIWYGGNWWVGRSAYGMANVSAVPHVAKA